MTNSKIQRLIQEAIERYGDLPALQLIDYWYRENYGGAIGWKVREELKLSDLADKGLSAADRLSRNITVRDFVGMLERADKNLPVKVMIEYADTKERWKKQEDENADLRREEERRIQTAIGPYLQPYYNTQRQLASIEKAMSLDPRYGMLHRKKRRRR